MASEDSLHAALDKLFEAATARHAHGGVDDFMLRVIIEATLPMAPLAAKDRCRRQLATNGSLFGGKAFQQNMYSLFAADSSTTSTEFLERIASETRRMALQVSRALTGGLVMSAEEKDAHTKYFSPSKSEETVIIQERSIIEMENEIKRLKAKCGELPMSSASDQSVAPAPTHSIVQQVSVPLHEVGTSDASYAIATLHERNARTADALARANEKLHAYGGFYDRRGDAIHKARYLASVTRHPNSHGGPGYSPYGGRMLSHSTSTMVTNNFSSPSRPLNADEALGMMLSTPPRGLATNRSPGYMRQPTSPSTSSSIPPAVSDYSAVTVALPASNLSRPSDTLLSMSMPLTIDDVKGVLLYSPANRPASQSATPFSSASIGSPFGHRSGGKSRLDSMYHILDLERQETNRWRSFGGQ